VINPHIVEYSSGTSVEMNVMSYFRSFHALIEYQRFTYTMNDVDYIVTGIYCRETKKYIYKDGEWI